MKKMFLLIMLFAIFLVAQVYVLSVIIPLIRTKDILLYSLISLLISACGFLLNQGIINLYFHVWQKMGSHYRSGIMFAQSSFFIFPATYAYIGMSHHWFWFVLAPLYKMEISLPAQTVDFAASFVIILSLLLFAISQYRNYLYQIESLSQSNGRGNKRIQPRK
jgi:hypothetical protein